MKLENLQQLVFGVFIKFLNVVGYFEQLTRLDLDFVEFNYINCICTRNVKSVNYYQTQLGIPDKSGAIKGCLLCSVVRNNAMDGT